MFPIWAAFCSGVSCGGPLRRTEPPSVIEPSLADFQQGGHFSQTQNERPNAYNSQCGVFGRTQLSGGKFFSENVLITPRGISATNSIRTRDFEKSQDSAVFRTSKDYETLQPARTRQPAGTRQPARTLQPAGTLQHDSTPKRGPLIQSHLPRRWLQRRWLQTLAAKTRRTLVGLSWFQSSWFQSSWFQSSWF